MKEKKNDRNEGKKTRYKVNKQNTEKVKEVKM